VRESRVVWDSRRLFEQGQAIPLIGLLRRCALSAGSIRVQGSMAKYRVIAYLGVRSMVLNPFELAHSILPSEGCQIIEPDAGI
jgi:hypothetical protein